MRILAIGNIFESKSFLVDEFCEKDSEVVANDVTSRISGAAIVVSAIAAFLNLEPFLYSKVKEEHSINDMLMKLSKVGVNTRLIDINDKEANILLTIYNAELERKCYSYTPNEVLAEDLLKIDFSEFDATFFCCIPFKQIKSIFEKNTSIKKNKSIILASGLTSPYFEKNKLKVDSDYIFMNRGELLKVFEKQWDGNQGIVDNCCDELDIGNTRDTYHKGDSPAFSMFTACEMLWAITSSGIYSKTHYLTVELLTAINTEIGNNHFEQQDRVFEKAFVLLAMTCAGQPIAAPGYIDIVRRILEEQRDSGAWGTYKEGIDDLRATALCVIALIECGFYVGKTDIEPFIHIEDKVKKACKWIVQQYVEEGYCKRKIISLEEYGQFQEYTYGVELTAWTSYALIYALENYNFEKTDKEKILKKVRKSIYWMLTLDGGQVAKVPEIEMELYKKGDELKNHEYGGGSLEIMILTLIKYRCSDIYEYMKGIDECISKSISRLLENEKEGKWYDKNSDSYSRIWPVSYAIKTLTSYQDFVLDKCKFKNELKKNIKLTISLIATKLHKYVFNWPLIILYFIVGAVGLYFHEFIKERVEFINSTLVGYLGLLLSAIGILLSIYYGRKNK